MKDKLPWMLVAALLGAFASMTLTTARADKGASRCDRWETTVWQDDPTVVRPLPEVGKPIVTVGPAGGWEPFATGAGGLLVYRRCAR